MTKKEADKLIKHLKSFRPEAEAIAERDNDNRIKSGEEPFYGHKYPAIVGVLTAKIEILIEDLEQGRFFD